MPHPLDGPRLKVRRARDEIQRLRKEEETFRSMAAYRIEKAELNPKTGQYRHRVRILRQPTLDDWGVWIGEIAHNLRSALDILVYELARLNGAPADVRDTQFPIFRYRFDRTIRGRTQPGFEGRKGARAPGGGSGRKMIVRLRNDHQSRIERLQPYRRQGAPVAFGRPLVGRWNLLYRLSELNNADKHRFIQVVGAKSGAGPWVMGWGDDLENDFRFPHAPVIREGAVIVEAAPNMHVASKMHVIIAFAESCEAVKHIGVCYVLALIADHVAEIIESFAQDFPS